MKLKRITLSGGLRERERREKGELMGMLIIQVKSHLSIPFKLIITLYYPLDRNRFYTRKFRCFRVEKRISKILLPRPTDLPLPVFALSAFCLSDFTAKLKFCPLSWWIKSRGDDEESKTNEEILSIPHTIFINKSREAHKDRLKRA